MKLVEIAKRFYQECFKELVGSNWARVPLFKLKGDVVKRLNENSIFSLEGALAVNGRRRWQINYPEGYEVELEEGTVFEVKLGEEWIKTGIECEDGLYLASAKGVLLIEGTPARLGPYIH